MLRTGLASWLPCWGEGFLARPGPFASSPQILAAALTECYRKSSAQGKPLALKVFVAGRNRLENDGATALADAFGVSGFCPSCSPQDRPGSPSLLCSLAGGLRDRWGAD